MEEEKDVKKEVTDIIEKSVSEKTDTIKKEIEKSVQEKNEAMQKSLDDAATQIKASEEKAKSLETEVTALKKEMEEKTETIKELGKQTKEAHVVNIKPVTYADFIFDEIMKNKEELLKIKSKNDCLYMNTVDAICKDAKSNERIYKAGDFLTTTESFVNTDGDPSRGILTDFRRDVTRIPMRMPFIREIINTYTTARPDVEWIETEELIGGAEMVPEGGLKPELKPKWISRREKAKKIAVRTVASMETLEDIEFAAREIAFELERSLLLKEETQILSGDGTGDNYKGILQYAPQFFVDATTYGRFFQNIIDPKEIDVLRASIAIIVTRYFRPTTILINPVDAAMIDMHKDLTAGYVHDPFTRSISNIMKNLIVREETAITEGTFLLGDMSRSNYAIRKGLSLTAGRGSINDDVEHNLYTFIAELRGYHYIKENEKNAFLQGNFEDAFVMLDKLSS